MESNLAIDSTSLAGYGQPRLELRTRLGPFLAGLRYTSDSKTGWEFWSAKSKLRGNPQANGTNTVATDITPVAISFAQQPGVSCLPTLLANGQYYRCLHGTSAAPTGTVDLKWAPDPNTLAYVRYSRGYKDIGLNAGTVLPDPEAKPEYLDDIEGGIKKTFGGNFQVDLDAYYYNYVNQQVPIGVPAGGIIQTQFINVPKTRADGVELAAVWDPVRDLDLIADLRLQRHRHRVGLHAGQRRVRSTGACYVDVVDPHAVLPSARPIGIVGTSTAQSVKGDPLFQAPRNKISLNANYTLHFDPGSLLLSVNYSWRDKSYSSVFVDPFDMAPAWSQVDLGATWRGTNDRYEVAVSVKNLFNTLGYDAAVTGIPLTVGANHVYDVTPPRLVSVEFRYKLH